MFPLLCKEEDIAILAQVFLTGGTPSPLAATGGAERLSAGVLLCCSLPVGLCTLGQGDGTSGSQRCHRLRVLNTVTAVPRAWCWEEQLPPTPRLHLCRAFCISPRLSILVSASQAGKPRHGVGREPSKICAVLLSTSMVGMGLNQPCPRLCCLWVPVVRRDFGMG